MSNRTYQSLRTRALNGHAESAWILGGASLGGVAYAYDAAGNRTMRTDGGAAVSYSLGAGDRLASWTGCAYSYDAAGCVTRIERAGRPTLGLTWNGQYQLVSVSTNGVFAEGYSYDALGRRVSTTSAEGTVMHVYDDGWQCVADIDEDGNVVASYVWGDGIDNLLAVKVGDETYYPLTDIQGTVWGYADAGNNVVARWTYDAWGNVLDESVSIPALATIRYRFQGREWSAATGLVNFRMRWYDPDTGRWLSKDPIGLGGGLNLYAFCENAPSIYIDPEGTGKLVIVVRIGKWSLKIIRRVSKDEAKRLYKKSGRDIIGSKQAIKKMSKRKGMKKVGPEVHYDPTGHGTAHYHLPNRQTPGGQHSGHGFLLSLTAVNLWGNHWYSSLIDFFNPISDVNDIINLFGEDDDNSEDALCH